MRNRSCIDSIDDYKSAVYLSIYRGGGLDPLQTNFRAYPEILTNKHSKKLGTLICSARARTVRARAESVRVPSFSRDLLPKTAGLTRETVGNGSRPPPLYR